MPHEPPAQPESGLAPPVACAEPRVPSAEHPKPRKALTFIEPAHSPLPAQAPALVGSMERFSGSFPVR